MNLWSTDRQKVVLGKPCRGCGTGLEIRHRQDGSPHRKRQLGRTDRGNSGGARRGNPRRGRRTRGSMTDRSTVDRLDGATRRAADDDAGVDTAKDGLIDGSTDPRGCFGSPRTTFPPHRQSGAEVNGQPETDGRRSQQGPSDAYSEGPSLCVQARAAARRRPSDTRTGDVGSVNVRCAPYPTELHRQGCTGPGRTDRLDHGIPGPSRAL